MADTALVVNSNRLLDDAYLEASSASVALDAIVFETFRLPTGFGQLIVKAATCLIGSLSGAYAAPAPAYDGIELYVLSSDLSTRIDLIGSVRFVNSGTISARPQLTIWIDLNNHVLVRQSDRFAIQAPVLAGAGVTGTVALRVRGRRIQTA